MVNWIRESRKQINSKNYKWTGTLPDGHMTYALVDLDLSSIPLPFKHHINKLVLLGSPPDTIPRRDDPEGQNVTVQTKTRAHETYCSESFNPA